MTCSRYMHIVSHDCKQSNKGRTYTHVGFRVNGSCIDSLKESVHISYRLREGRHTVGQNTWFE